MATKSSSTHEDDAEEAKDTKQTKHKHKVGEPSDAAEAFTAAVDIIAPAVKKLTDAGMGGGEAGKLALEIFKETCCD